MNALQAQGPKPDAKRQVSGRVAETREQMHDPELSGNEQLEYYETDVDEQQNSEIAEERRQMYDSEPGGNDQVEYLETDEGQELHSEINDMENLHFEMPSYSSSSFESIDDKYDVMDEFRGKNKVGSHSDIDCC